MDRKEVHDNQQMRATALRLVRCLGSRDALRFCKNNQWHGLYEVIKDLGRDARTAP